MSDESMNLYNFNQQIMSNKSYFPLTEEEMEKGIATIKDYIKSFTTAIRSRPASYFMLLCNEKKDYTIFHINKESKTKLIDDILDCAKNRGEILAIDLTTDKNAIEIWIRDGGVANLYYFFDYSEAVIESEAL